MRTVPGARLVAVVDPIQESRELVADEVQVPAYARLEDVPDIDAAIVATTTECHHEVGLALLHRGAHLLVEKPLAKSTAEAAELVSEATSRGLVLQVGHVERFNPAWRAVQPHIRRPRYLEAVRTSGYTFRSIDIGAVLDLMIHDLDLVLSVVRSELVDVEALGSTIFGPFEDMAHAHLRFANGCIANLNASRTSFQSQRTMQIVSERSYVGLDFGAPSAKVVRPSKAVLRREIDVQVLSRSEREKMRHTLFTDLLPVRELPLAPVNAILDEQFEFCACIRGEVRPRVSGADGLRSVAVAEKILEQIRSSEFMSPRITAAAYRRPTGISIAPDHRPGRKAG
jgi:predicted dehydrogenase